MRPVAFLFVSLCAAGAAACSTTASIPPERDIAAMRSVIEAQQAAWNRGDIPAFMDGYLESETLRFASGGTVVRGWRETLERYKLRYDTPGKMGELEFSELEIERLGPDAGVIHGRWQLRRDGDDPSGLFTLITRRTQDGWKIVSDTTTSAD